MGQVRNMFRALVVCSCRGFALAFAGGEWFGTLSAFGWNGGDARLKQLCDMIVRNEVMSWSQLAFVSEPATLEGAEEFSVEELSILSRLKSRGEDVPRSPVPKTKECLSSTRCLVPELTSPNAFVKELQRGHLGCLERPVWSQRVAEGAGPMRALKKLDLVGKTQQEKLAWIAEVRTRAVFH